MEKKSLKVEVWSDLLCPFCYIGKRRLEGALARFAHAGEVEVEWRAFELDPRAPAAYPGTVNDLLVRKYGMSPARAQAAHDDVTALAAKDGLDYRFDRTRPGNTLDGHRVVQMAKAVGKGDAMEERLMRAYFTEGASLADRAELARLAGEVGLDAAGVKAALEGDAEVDAVRADEREAAELGIRGVPAFVIGGTHLVSGAQSVDTIVKALEAAWDARPAATAGEGAACTDEACAS